MPRRTQPSVGIAALVAGLALVACGANQANDDDGEARSSSPSPSSSTVPPEVSGSLAHLVPVALRGTTVTLGFRTDEQPPHVTKAEDGSWSGTLTEVVRAAVDRLGLATTDVDVAGDDPLGQLAAGTVTLLVSATNPGEVVYENADGVSVVEQDEIFIAGPDVDLGTEPTDLCGLRIGYIEADSPSSDELQGYLAEMAAVCQSRDLPALEPVPFEPGGDRPIEAVARGELDATPTGEFFASYWLIDHPDLTVGGPVRGTSVTVFLVSKQSELAAPLAAAVDALVADGTYEAIMDEHRLLSRPPSPAEVNPQESRR